MAKEYTFKTAVKKQEFDRLVAEGYDPFLADMKVHQRYPEIKTNATVTRGMDTSTVFSRQLNCAIDTSNYAGHIKQICEERNLNCEGVVEHKAREVEPTPNVKLAVDLIDESISDEIRMDPSKASKPRQELVEMVTEKYGSPHVK
jgi:hypothetical protein